jgi:uncharacterized peroxidase-related enzyme
MFGLRQYFVMALIVFSPILLAEEKAGDTATNNVDEKRALIEMVSPENAKGDVATVYKEIKSEWDMIPNPIKLYSTNPEMLRHKWESYKMIGQHKTVDAKLQTVIRMLVSAQHDCAYCVGLNESMLINMFKMDAGKVMAMKKNPKTAPLPEKEKVLLLFTLKAVSDPKSTSKEDIDALHKIGWSDAEIFFATSYAAEMVATDILINAFKVKVDY